MHYYETLYLRPISSYDIFHEEVLDWCNVTLGQLSVDTSVDSFLTYQSVFGLSAMHSTFVSAECVSDDMGQRFSVSLDPDLLSR